MQAADFSDKQYYHQDPKLLAIRAQQAPRPRQVHATSPSFARISKRSRDSGREAGILEGTAHFDDYADPSFVRDETTDSNPTTGRARLDRRDQDTPRTVRMAATGRAGRSLCAGRGRAVLLAWEVAVRYSGNDLFPGPLGSGLGIVELVRKGLLPKYIVASLFRVTWGFSLAVLVGVPLGLFLGWFRPAYQAFNPLDPGAEADLADRLDPAGDPLVRSLRRGARVPDLPGQRLPDHGLGHGGRAEPPAGLPPGGAQLRARPLAAVPQSDPAGDAFPRSSRVFGSRSGVAWLVVVAAEMIAVNSGLGYLIIDARNAGKRYDLVVAGMVVIGLIGLVLDLLVRRLEDSRKSAGVTDNDEVPGLALHPQLRQVPSQRPPGTSHGNQGSLMEYAREPDRPRSRSATSG